MFLVGSMTAVCELIEIVSRGVADESFGSKIVIVMSGVRACTRNVIDTPLVTMIIRLQDRVGIVASSNEQPAVI